mgnify:CR=1 FL=1
MDFINTISTTWTGLNAQTRFLIGTMAVVTVVYVVIKMMFWPIMIGLMLATAGTLGAFVFSIDTIIQVAKEYNLDFLVGPLTSIKVFFNL